MREIIIAGAGTGSDLHLTQEFQEALKKADVIFSHSRFINLIPESKKFFELKNFGEAFNIISHESGKILLIVSGDPGIFSLLALVKKRFAGENIRVIPGISALQIISAAAQESWHDAKIFSGHGRELDAGKFLNAVERNRVVILFCDRNISPEWACKNLECIKNLEIYIGENLGHPDEKIYHGSPENFSCKNFSSLSILLVKNNNIYIPEKIHLRDKDFIRSEKIVMTNESVRAVILSRLELNHNSVLWDIGAGSGSISISAAHENNDIEIHAVEYKHEAVNIIDSNAKKFHLHNIKIHEARALEAIKFLPAPSHVFIGGTDSELTGILEYLEAFNVRVVVACVTLETFCAAYEILKRWKNFEAVQISANVSKYLSHDLTMIKANNPVMILSANNKQKFSKNFHS